MPTPAARAVQTPVLTRPSRAGPLPESWSRFTQLEELELEFNPVGGTLPASWSVMNQLRTVTVKKAGMSGTIPEAWSSMRSLRFLDVGDNPAVGGTLPSLVGWSSIAFLFMRNCSFTGTLGCAAVCTWRHRQGC